MKRKTFDDAVLSLSITSLQAFVVHFFIINEAKGIGTIGCTGAYTFNILRQINDVQYVEGRRGK